MMNRPARLMILLLLAACAAAPFLQTMRHGFVNYDDPLYITENPYVRQGLTIDGVKWAFTRTHAGNWHPLTWLSHMLDVSLFGLDAGYHHLVSLCWHVLNTLLLYLVLFRMTGARLASMLAALLFAVHPTHVQSVAWIAERKDLVSTFLGLACIGAYASYARTPSVGKYTIVFLLLALGLMAKPMLVTWPCLFLLLDFWPLNRFRDRRPDRIIAEKLPLLMLSAVSSIITIKAHRQAGALGSLDAHPLTERLVGALVAYAGYIERMAWPFDLVVFYPPVETTTFAMIPYATLLVMGITIPALYAARRRPYLIVGWLWYLGTLTPVIGLVRQGSQSMPDHFTYVSYIGLFIMFAWSTESAIRFTPRPALFFRLMASFMLFLLLALSWMQASHWSDSIRLFRRNLAVYPHNAVAHHNLALALDEQNRAGEAMLHYRRALAAAPHSARMLNSLGAALARSGDTEAALNAFTRAVAFDPSHAVALKNMGLLLNAKGRHPEALHYLNRAADILRQAGADVWAGAGHVLEQTELTFHLGRIHVETGQVHRGITAYRLLESDRPELAARLAIAVACHYHHAGDVVQAIAWGARARRHGLFEPDLLKSDEGMNRLCRSRVWLRP